MRRMTQQIAGLAVLAVAVAACTGGGPGQPAQAATLTPFEECGELRDYFVEHALDMVGPYGLEDHRGGPRPDVVEEGAQAETAEDAEISGDAATSAPAPRSAQGPVQGEDFSGTNVQEAGVDEPDHVKTDGERLLALDDDRLHVLDVTGSSPERIGEVTLSHHGGEMLLAGDRAVVISREHDEPVRPMPERRPSELSSEPHRARGPVTTLTLVDLADEPAVAETLQFDGAYVSGRMVDGEAHIVVRTDPVGLDFTTPEGSGLRAEREATERNEQIIRDSDIDNWLPYMVHQRRDGETVDGRLVDCSQVHRPDEFSGLGLAAVVTVDPAGDLEPAGASAVVGAGDTVYASQENLYVATQRWADRNPERDDARDPSEMTTELHQFSLGETPAPHVASGQVPGRLLNQWALSEHDGHLRVATTEGNARWGPGPEDGPEASESAVRVLRAEDGKLEEVGAVTGLGVGERIYAVRYIGDIGYVVTFRETDPLYTVDLSDPADPRVRGELKILGYSSYLHPVGDGLLLGVGQDANEEGRTRGTQVSLFDVADLGDPTRLHKETIPGGHSPVEDDHKALLHWPAEDLTVVPVRQHPREVEPLPEPEPETEPEIEPSQPPREPAEAFAGAIAYDVGRDGIEELGRIAHPADGRGPPMITRSLVVDDTLYTISDAGVLASDVDTLETRSWLAW